MKFPAIFKNSNFFYLWSSQLISQVCLNLVVFISLLRIFESTNSTIATSFVWIAYALPAVLIGPFAVASVDIFDKRKLLMVSNFAQSVVLFLYAAFLDRSLYLAYLVVFFYQFFNQFYLPSESAALPELVNKKNYPQANSVFFLTLQFASIIGFGGGGLLNEFVGAKMIFFLTSVLLLIAFTSVSFLPSMQIKKDIQKDMEKGIGKFFTKIADGYQFIKSHKIVLFPFLLIMTLQVSIIVLSTVLPIIAKDIIRIPSNFSGLLIVVPVGVGAGLGTYIISKLLKKGIRKKNIIGFSFLVISIAFWFSALFLPDIEGPSRLLISAIAFTLAGVAYVGIYVSAQTFLQEVTPGGYRGRVFGNFWLLTTIATVIPVIFSATITEIFGITTLLALIGFGSGLVFIITRFNGKLNLLNHV